MFGARRIITAKQMRTSLARKSTVIKDFAAKGGNAILQRKVKPRQRELWGALRQESKSHDIGQRGFTKIGLTKFLGKMLNNKKDSFVDKKVKKIADMYDIKRKKVYEAAAEAKHSEVVAKGMERQQLPAQTQNRAQENTQFRDHLQSIIDAGKAKNALTHPDSIPMPAGELVKNINFSASDAKIRDAQGKGIFADPVRHPAENHAETFGHLKFLKNYQHDYVTEEKKEDEEEEKIKARLARIQGKPVEE